MASLVANNIVTGSPILSTGVIDTSSIIDWYAYFFEPITYVNPSIAQDQVLVTLSLVSGQPTVSTSAFVQGHLFTPTIITGGEPYVPIVTMSEEETPRATPILTGSPIVGATGITQDQQLTTSDIIATPVVDTLELSEENALTASGIASEAPTLGTPITVVNWVLFADGFVTGQPNVDNSTISQVHVISCDSVEAQTPEVGTTEFIMGHNFVANPVITLAPRNGFAFINGSKRRVLSVTSDSTTRVTISELYNTIEFNVSANSATYQEEFNRVS